MYTPVLLKMADDFALRMMKKLGWQEYKLLIVCITLHFTNIFLYYRGKGLGKEENGRVKPVQVEQKQNAKGIGYGTEGAFAPWWDDLYNKTAVGTQIKSKEKDKKKKAEAENKEKKAEKIKSKKREESAKKKSKKVEKSKKKDKKSKKSKEQER